ncbi:MAG: hypothetical protein QXW71_02920 [Thermoplasmata archaeon]
MSKKIIQLQEKLEQAYKIIDCQQQQITELNKQYSNVISKKEYDFLLYQYKQLEERYRILQSLYEKKNSKPLEQKIKENSPCL